MDKAIRSGGGEVRIPAGTLILEKGLRVENARNLRISGADRSSTILKLPPVTFAETDGRGVAFYSVQDSEVSHCEISDTTDEAVDFDHFSVRISVHDNELRHSSEGMELNDANDCVVRNNRFIECSVGINLWQFVKFPGWNEGNVIEGNRFERTKKAALQIQKGLTKNKVSGNTIVPP
jgi:parallel beta-helix repeat protein